MSAAATDDTIAVLEDTSEGILHAVYDIIKGVERDGGVDDKVNQLRSRLETARSLVQSLKGTDLSPDEQLDKAQLLQNKLIAKRRLLLSYKHMCGLFELPESGSGQFPAQMTIQAGQNVAGTTGGAVGAGVGNAATSGGVASATAGGSQASNGLLNGDADHLSSGTSGAAGGCATGSGGSSSQQRPADIGSQQSSVAGSNNTLI